MSFLYLFTNALTNPRIALSVNGLSRSICSNVTITDETDPLIAAMAVEVGLVPQSDTGRGLTDGRTLLLFFSSASCNKGHWLISTRRNRRSNNGAFWYVCVGVWRWVD